MRRRRPVCFRYAEILVVSLPVGHLAVFAAVGHEAAPGAGRELGDAASGDTFLWSKAIPTHFGVRDGALFVLW